MKKFKKVPKFKNEQEERAFWETHDTTEYFDWSKARVVTFPNLKKTDNVNKTFIQIKNDLQIALKQVEQGEVMDIDEAFERAKSSYQDDNSEVSS